MRHPSIVVHSWLWSERGWSILALATLLCIASRLPATAQLASQWQTNLHTPGNIHSSSVGVAPWARDGWDGGGPLIIDPGASGIFILLYREQGPGWEGSTGFYPYDYDRSPIPPGESKTWWDFYLWAQNYTPSPPDRVEVRNSFELDRRPPAGYIGHLVIDEVPSGVTWTGPMDYWFDMTVKNNTFILPIAEVTDPLQGTRFHLTVYTPEPSSLLALIGGIAGLAGFALRRRRR